MTGVLYAVIYGGFLAFVVGCVVRAVTYARKPLHLRWELYPVPHEEASRAKYGGSYFETVDWWTKPTSRNLGGELKVMVPEMLFLKALRDFNRKLWRLSFPFHFGLYLLLGSVVLVVLTATGSFIWPNLRVTSLGIVLHAVYTVAGCGGAALAIFGCLGLLYRRLTDDDLKSYTVPADVFNLALFIFTMGALAAGYLFRSSTSPSVAALVKGLVTFNTKVVVPGVLVPGLVLGALLIAYIPYTHMSHFIAKYFTYHAVRWDDAANIDGSALQKKMAEYLTYRPTWSARHIGADGTKTWVDLAVASPPVEKKK